jgi:hypothetical protein
MTKKGQEKINQQTANSILFNGNFSACPRPTLA